MRHHLFGAAIAGILLLTASGGFAEDPVVRSVTPHLQTVEKARSFYYTPVCGNKIADPGEACDDGKQCVNGTPCTSDADCWSVQVTGSGPACAPRDGDGCSSDCKTRFKSAQARVCSNGVIDPGEQCDPPNGTSCGSDCQYTYSISAVPNDGLVLKNDGGILFPHSSVCGDGVKESDEGCDDGNTVSGDGCSATCTDEAPGSVCGNGVLEPGEGCEDGNTVNGDGCSASCAIEPPPVCGNGILEAGEECDDGNTAGGDGCSPHCKKTGP